MSTKRKLLVIGGSYMNLQMKISPKTKTGSTTTGNEYCFHPFGDSAIVAIATAKNGGSCVFATRFGDDINGKRLYEYYKGCGISKQLMRKDKDSQTGLCLTLFSDRFEHEHFLSKGASMRFTKDEIDEALVTLPDLFLAPLEELGYEEHMIVVPAEQIPEESLDEEITQALMPELMIETSEFAVIPFEEEPTVGEFSTGYDFLEENASVAAEPTPKDETEKQEPHEAEENVLTTEGTLTSSEKTVPEEPISSSENTSPEEDSEAQDPTANAPTQEIPVRLAKEKIISSETVSSYIEKESLALYAVTKAEEKGIDMLVQYTPFTAQYPLENLEHIKFFVISDEDLYDLTGFFPDNPEKTLRALIALSDKIKAKYYIIQRGDDSVFIYDGKRYEIVFAPETIRKDTREIGFKMKPTFIGAFAAEYLETKNIVHACHMATIVSLLTRTKFGNLEKLMTREELIRYATEHGIHLFK
ncbi:MAG: hypothetical protein E7603_07110 [Ruminococcaceae bacterium]|nr:hypothetical protein [Oscillospiraceae bacterium]